MQVSPYSVVSIPQADMPRREAGNIEQAVSVSVLKKVMDNAKSEADFIVKSLTQKGQNVDTYA